MDFAKDQVRTIRTGETITLSYSLTVLSSSLSFKKRKGERGTFYFSICENNSLIFLIFKKGAVNMLMVFIHVMFCYFDIPFLGKVMMNVTFTQHRPNHFLISEK